jgi:predicted amidohydrolase
MKIAAAQINSVVEEINNNLELHYQMINFAVKKGAKLISFPEMSITGYCRKEGNKLALSKNDSSIRNAN